MLLLVRILAAARETPLVFSSDDLPVQVAFAFRANGVLGHVIPTTELMPALAEAHGAIGVLKLDNVMIENFSVVRPFAHLAATVAARLHRMAFFQPVNHVEVVNV